MFNTTNRDERMTAVINTYNATLQKNYQASKVVEETNKTLEILKFQMEALKGLEDSKEEKDVDVDN